MEYEAWDPAFNEELAAEARRREYEVAYAHAYRAWELALELGESDDHCEALRSAAEGYGRALLLYYADVLEEAPHTFRAGEAELLMARLERELDRLAPSPATPGERLARVLEGRSIADETFAKAEFGYELLLEGREIPIVNGDELTERTEIFDTTAARLQDVRERISRMQSFADPHAVRQLRRDQYSLAVSLGESLVDHARFQPVTDAFLGELRDEHWAYHSRRFGQTGRVRPGALSDN